MNTQTATPDDFLPTRDALSENDYNEIMRLDELMPVSGGPGNKPGTEIWFSGVNIDPKNAWTHTNAGNMERLADGVYINVRNESWMPEMTPKRRRDLILRHAVRIARHLFSDTTLMGSSAYHCAPVDGVLCIASTGKSKYSHKDIGGVLTIYHSHIGQGIPIGAPVVQSETEDTLGPIVVEVLPDEILILQYFTPFRRKPPQQTQLSLGDLHAVIERAVLKHGTKEALLRRLLDVATAMSYTVQLRYATEAIHRSFIYSQKKKNLFEYFVYWNKVRSGTLAYDGTAWRFDYDAAFKLRLSLNQKLKPGMVPSFLGSVLPETGELDSLIEQGFTEFKMADRYISNITVRKTSDSTVHGTVHVDRLAGRLEDHWKHGFEFSGTVGEDLSHILDMQSLDPSILTNAMEDPRSPRISGMQLKLAGHLSESGELSLVNGNKKAFTHIIKPPPPGHQCSVGTMEWFGMCLAMLCKLSTEVFAIADLGGYGPTFIAERFDIPQSADDESMILLEDFWSVYGLRNPQHKYTGDLLEIARTIRARSTSPDEDSRMLFKQALFSWLTVNSDMHLKNLMLIKYGNSDLTAFEQVRLSPAYDILCTNVYPKDPKSAALALGGTKFYTLASFRELGRALKIKNEESETMIKEMIVRLVGGADSIMSQLPDLVKAHAPSMDHLEMARALMQQRCRQMLKEFENRKTNRISFGEGAPEGATGDDDTGDVPEPTPTPRRATF